MIATMSFRSWSVDMAVTAAGSPTYNHPHGSGQPSRRHRHEYLTRKGM